MTPFVYRQDSRRSFACVSPHSSVPKRLMYGERRDPIYIIKHDKVHIYLQEETAMSVLEVSKKKEESSSMQQMHEVEFTFHAPESRKVHIAGNFNAWNVKSSPMKKGRDGTWRVKLKLSPGKYEYRYFVDGTWASNQPCAELVANTFGTNNCAMSVH
jgi:1,4-alpha-glucan branching enzyme